MNSRKNRWLGNNSIEDVAFCKKATSSIELYGVPKCAEGCTKMQNGVYLFDTFHIDPGSVKIENWNNQCQYGEDLNENPNGGEIIAYGYKIA